MNIFHAAKLANRPLIPLPFLRRMLPPLLFPMSGSRFPAVQECSQVPEAASGDGNP